MDIQLLIEAGMGERNSILKQNAIPNLKSCLKKLMPEIKGECVLTMPTEGFFSWTRKEFYFKNIKFNP